MTVILPVVLWIVAFAAPLLAVASKAAAAGPGVLQRVLSPYVLGVMRFTFAQAAASTILSVLFGLPGAYILGRYRFAGRGLLRSVTTVPFVLPPILAVLGFILVFGNSGLLNTFRVTLAGDQVDPWRILYTPKAIILAHVFYNFPITLRVVGDAWSALPESTYRAARMLGASRFRRLMSVDLPALAPSILTSSLMTFLFCFLSFTVVVLLGGGPQTTTLEVEVYRLVRNFDIAGASVLAVLETLIVSTLMILYLRTERRLPGSGHPDDGAAVPRPPSRLTPLGMAAAMPYILSVLIIIVLPLIAVIADSLLERPTRSAPATLSVNHWVRLFGGERIGAGVPVSALGRTVILGTVVAFITVAMSAIMAWHTTRRNGVFARILNFLSLLPMGVSTIILGFGFLILTSRVPRSPPLRIAAICAIHVMIALPFAYRIIASRLARIPRRITQSARISGAGPVRTWMKIELPLIRKSLVSAAVFSFALSAGELNAALVLAPAGFTTVPLAIYRLIGSYEVNSAGVLGTILIIFSTLTFFVIDRGGEDTL